MGDVIYGQALNKKTVNPSIVVKLFLKKTALKKLTFDKKKYKKVCHSSPIHGHRGKWNKLKIEVGM